MAVFYAEHISLPFFNWGKQYDMTSINYEIILYFQFGNQQLSFHTNQFEDVKNFDGQWIGHTNFSCPVNYRMSCRMLKNNNISRLTLKSTPFIKNQQIYLKDGVKNILGGMMPSPIPKIELSLPKKDVLEKKQLLLTRFFKSC